MLIVRYVVMSEIMDKASIGMKFSLATFDFFLLILSVVAVTAAGNIINDYFDQKVDKINKPERVMVGKKVKRRVAILLHQALNISGILFSLFVCVRTGYYWPIIIPIFIITILWWYSPIFKKKIFIGNLSVAVCTAAVPLWAALFEILVMKDSYGDLLVDSNSFFTNLWLWIFALCSFALLLTLIREAVKDMEDMQGDKEGEYHTIPLVFGEIKTKRYIYGLMSIFLIAAGLGVSRLSNLNDYIFFGVLILLPALFTTYSIAKASTQKDYRNSSFYLKVMILCGLAMIVIVLR
jgi:4-hydroxybenzoate polyprenyltransferase